ncbi:MULTISPECIES: alpha/beta fold hydrolase [Synechococcales]|uniref:alpha/beta fold hydrolase n=1 Tax=Synechococcus sp. CS-1333 TaxID=2848638 RepID=UPI00223A8025|nr:alpha/beta hydrolase [Synechococcus sp. CS-1333]
MESTPVVLLHGFPDDLRTWDVVSKQLVSMGYRTIAPYLRGFGETHFLDSHHSRSGQTGSLASDLIDLVDALGLTQFVLVGHDIGASAALVATPLLSDRVRALVLLSPDLYDAPGLPPRQLQQAQAYWYQWYFCTAAGRATLAADRRAFCRWLWHSWSPGWGFTDEEFDLTANSFDNPDFIEVVMHFYRHSSGEVKGHAPDDEIERRAALASSVFCPTTILHGAEDFCTLPSASRGREAYFTGPYERQVLTGVGHFLPREAPGQVALAVDNLIEIAFS